MSKAPDAENIPNRLSGRSRGLLADPFVWSFAALAVASLIISGSYTGDWLSNLLFPAGLAIAAGIIVFMSHRINSVPVTITEPVKETVTILGWFLMFFLADFLTKGNSLLSNEFGKWACFIICPLGLLFLIRGHKESIKTLTGSIGIRKAGLGKGLLAAVAAFLVMIPVIALAMPETQRQELVDLFQKPGNGVLILLISFILSLLTAAATEELFFRGMIQSRLARVTGSEIRGCLAAAFLFGLYHLPYAYYSEYWASQGNFLWAVTGILSEQMLTGVVLGLLWMRTRNIFAPILLHALINLIPIATSLNFGPPG